MITTLKVDTKMSTSPPAQEPTRKRKRVTRACDGCHRRGIKCAPSNREGMCQSCVEYGTACTYDRPVKRRGPPASTNPSTNGRTRAVSNGSHATVPGPSPSSSCGGSHLNAGESWRPPESASLETIQALIDCYHQIVYPIFPFFHWPSFSDKVQREVYKTDRAFCASVMAVCAVASARVRDGATFSALADLPQGSQDTLTKPPSEVFFAAAEAAIPKNLVDAPGFDYMRATALLSILGIQNGQLRLMHQFLGNYWTLVAIEGLHAESRWPKGLGTIEIEERRRLFWSIYTLEVYSSIVWGGIIRCREAQSQVSYPTEVDDEFIGDAGASTSSQPSDRISWIHGWNFTTDLYRILEHAVDQLRTGRPVDLGVSAVFAEATKSPSPSAVLDLVRIMYDKLPNRFKETRAVSSYPADDRFSFQAANIIVTMQTVRMVVLGSEEASVEKRCDVAGQLLDALSTVPTAYLRAISSPLLHHLAGIGHILGGVIQGPLSQWSFLQVRNVLLAMADLLAGLESTLSFAAGTSERLKDHVHRIDRYMTQAALERQNQRQVYHNALPRSVFNTPPRDLHSLPTGGLPLDWTTTVGNMVPDNQMLPVPADPTGAMNGGSAPPQDGIPPFQFQLPDELLVDWPFDLGQSRAFDFLVDGLDFDSRQIG